MAIKFDELLEALDPSLDKFEEDLDSMWIIIPTERRYDDLTADDYFKFARKYGTFNNQKDCFDKIEELAPDRWDAFIPMKLEGVNESLNEALNRYTFGQDFEKYIPHNMRYKEYDFIKDNGQDILYWITQDTFDDSDIEDFQYALSDETDFDGALVILRDDSSYSYDKDKNSGKGAFIKNSYAEEDFDESLNEAMKNKHRAKSKNKNR